MFCKKSLCYWRFIGGVTQYPLRLPKDPSVITVAKGEQPDILVGVDSQDGPELDIA